MTEMSEQESVKSFLDLHLDTQFGAMLTLVDKSKEGKRVSCSFQDDTLFSFVTSNCLAELVPLPEGREEQETDFENCAAWTTQISRDELLELFANFCVEFEK